MAEDPVTHDCQRRVGEGYLPPEVCPACLREVSAVKEENARLRAALVDLMNNSLTAAETRALLFVPGSNLGKDWAARCDRIEEARNAARVVIHPTREKP